MNEPRIIQLDKQNLAPTLEKEFADLGFNYSDLVRSAIRHSDQTFHFVHIEESWNANNVKDEIVFEFRTHSLVPGIPDQLDAMFCKYMRFKFDTQRMEDLISMRFYKINKPWPNKEQICSSIIEAAKLHALKEKFAVKTIQEEAHKVTRKRVS